MRDGNYCYPLTVTDQHSRYLLGCRGVDSTTEVPAQRVFKPASAAPRRRHRRGPCRLHVRLRRRGRADPRAGPDAHRVAMIPAPTAGPRSQLEGHRGDRRQEFPARRRDHAGGRFRYECRAGIPGHHALRVIDLSGPAGDSLLRFRSPSWPCPDSTTVVWAGSPRWLSARRRRIW